MLSYSCEHLSGVGDALAKKLAKCRIFTIKDLIFHLPFRYQDRTRITSIQDMQPKSWCVTTGNVIKTTIERRTMVCTINDGSGILNLRFFYYNPQQLKQLQTMPQLKVFGEVRVFKNQLEIVHPEYQVLAETPVMEENLTPIYPTAQGLSQTRLRSLIKKVFTNFSSEINSLELFDVKKLRLMPLGEALVLLHNPPPEICLETLENGTHPAMCRLIFEELLCQQISLKLAKKDRQSLHTKSFSVAKKLTASFLKNLPFELTNAQQKVFKEVSCDSIKDYPMQRLVQGDVGSGKTVIAALGALQVINKGYKVALMAPTDLLSEQHYNSFRKWFEKLGIAVYRLSSQMPKKARKITLLAMLENKAAMFVGTHALFQKDVEFNKLGLIIIDEQHRFGVEQRLKFFEKGVPHQLFMTATPIPRTLLMAHLTHIEISTINELPPMRQSITTTILSQTKRDDLVLRLAQHLNLGTQAYWVCPLINESEKLQCQAVTEAYHYLAAKLSNVKIAMIHGRLSAAEKEQIMQRFRDKELNLLVATTVIEVGVDVPNATMMIIENSERLGLSQLHQLRGRVGRGAKASFCVLLYQQPLSNDSKERLAVMRKTQNGFEIAEKDLKIRGSGELFGQRQTGFNAFKVAKLPRDTYLLSKINQTADDILASDFKLAMHLSKRWHEQATKFFNS